MFTVQVLRDTRYMRDGGLEFQGLAMQCTMEVILCLDSSVLPFLSFNFVASLLIPNICLRKGALIIKGLFGEPDVLRHQYIIGLGFRDSI